MKLDMLKYFFIENFSTNPIILQHLKNFVCILTTLLFTLSTLIMPYGNFNDTKSLVMVYNNCLQKDADLNVIEFIGEKMLCVLFNDEDDDQQTTPIQHNTPIHNSSIQIQSGLLFGYPVHENIKHPVKENALHGIASNDVLNSQNFHPGIFHPPSS